MVRDEHRGDARVVHPEPDAVARDPGLRDLEDGSADPIAVADAHRVVGESVHGEVLAELSVDEVVSAELTFPVPVRVGLVDEHCALFAAVPGEIALAVTVDVELSDAPRADHGILEDAGEDRPSSPVHVLRQADVDRHKPAGDLVRFAVRRQAFGPSIATSSATISAAGCVRLANATLCPAHIDNGSISPVVPTIGGAGS